MPKPIEENGDVLIVVVRAAMAGAVACGLGVSYFTRPVGFGNEVEITTAAWRKLV